MINKKAKASSLPTDIDPKVMELYHKLFNATKESMAIEEHESLENQTMVIARNARGQLLLLLLNNDGGFEKLGKDHAGSIPEEDIYNIFKWFKGKSIQNFTDLSAYISQAAENKSKIS